MEKLSGTLGRGLLARPAYDKLMGPESSDQESFMKWIVAIIQPHRLEAV